MRSPEGFLTLMESASPPDAAGLVLRLVLAAGPGGHAWAVDVAGPGATVSSAWHDIDSLRLLAVAATADGAVVQRVASDVEIRCDDYHGAWVTVTADEAASAWDDRRGLADAAGAMLDRVAGITRAPRGVRMAPAGPVTPAAIEMRSTLDP
jgi:hypothetical protein